MGKVIGIDLGTTNSVVAVMEGSDPKVIPNKEGGRITPSIVAFKDNECLVGNPAKRQSITNPMNTIFSIKRFMGRRSSEIDEEKRFVPYQIVGVGEETVKVESSGKTYSPAEISAIVLRHLKEYAEDYLGEPVTQAVITVPAYFNDSQRQATKDAGKIAGLEVLRIINEPTASCLAYGLRKKGTHKIAVYDLGGGTFDISILEVDEGVFKVLSTNGDTHLGGDNFDNRLLEYVADEFQKENSIDLRKDPMALQRLKEACEKAKCELSGTIQTTINLPFITADQAGPKHLQMNITRAKFEELVDDLVDQSKGPCQMAIRDAKLQPADVDEIILVGGSTRMPCIQAMAKEIFGKDPVKNLNPDEVVALGAAIQGGILRGEESLQDVVLIDVTPLSLGIETLGGVMTRLIDRNSRIPTEKSETFSTAADNQPAVEIHVLQGEREFARDNRSLGKFHLTGIPPAPRGLPQIEVTFKIDVNGILSVSAKDKATGKEQSITVTASSGLSQEEIDRMSREAEENATQDKAKRELIEKKNQADSIVYQTEKTLKEYGDKLSDEQKKAIEDAMEDVKKAKEGEDSAAIDQALEKLQEASQEIGKILYQQASQEEGQAPPFDPNMFSGGGMPPGGPGPNPGQDPGQGGGGTSKDDDNVIDADFEVKE